MKKLIIFTYLHMFMYFFYIFREKYFYFFYILGKENFIHKSFVKIILTDLFIFPIISEFLADEGKRYQR